MKVGDRRVHEIMSTGLHEIAASRPLLDAAREMQNRRIHALFIPPSRPQDSLGVVTMKDVVQILAHEDEDVLAEMTVEDVMVRPALTVPGEMSVRDALRMMRMTGIRRAPVVRAGAVVGVFSYSDVLRALLAD